MSDGEHDPGPEECPSCKTPSHDNVIELPPFINLSSAIGKSRDASYRMWEKESEQRIEMAAAETGMDKKDLSHLKVTNMRDNLREGDISAIIPTVKNDTTAVTEQMEMMKAKGLPTGFVPPTQAGGTGAPNQYANATHDMLKGGHAKEAAVGRQAGQLYKPFVG